MLHGSVSGINRREVSEQEQAQQQQQQQGFQPQIVHASHTTVLVASLLKALRVAEVHGRSPVTQQSCHSSWFTQADLFLGQVVAWGVHGRCGQHGRTALCRMAQVEGHLHSALHSGDLVGRSSTLHVLHDQDGKCVGRTAIMQVMPCPCRMQPQARLTAPAPIPSASCPATDFEAHLLTGKLLCGWLQAHPYVGMACKACSRCTCFFGFRV